VIDLLHLWVMCSKYIMDARIIERDRHFLGLGGVQPCLEAGKSLPHAKSIDTLKKIIPLIRRDYCLTTHLGVPVLCTRVRPYASEMACIAWASRFYPLRRENAKQNSLKRTR
jgi:hypothetical protein